MEKEENNTDEYWFENERFSSFWKTYQNINQPNTVFTSFCHRFNAIKQASYAAHIMASKLTKETLLKLDNQSETEEEPQQEIQAQREAVESEIDEEFIKFYEETLRYKKEKKAIEKKKLKQMQDEGISVEHVSGEQVNLNRFKSSKNAPLQRAGIAREEELAILYGEGAATIHLLETKLQMKFDKNLDLYQPVYWPSFPLRIEFN